MPSNSPTLSDSFDVPKLSIAPIYLKHKGGVDSRQIEVILLF